MALTPVQNSLEIAISISPAIPIYSNILISKKKVKHQATLFHSVSETNLVEERVHRNIYINKYLIFFCS